MRNDYVKTSIHVPRAWHNAVRRVAIRRGVSMSQYIMMRVDGRLVSVDEQAAAVVLHAVRELRNALVAGVEMLRRCQDPPEEAIGKMTDAVRKVEKIVTDLRHGRIGAEPRRRGRPRTKQGGDT